MKMPRRKVSGTGSGLADLWGRNPWLTSHMIGAAHSQSISATQQEREHGMYAALIERSAQTPADAARKLEKEEAERHNAALRDWEDEGGSTVVPVPASTPSSIAESAAG